MSYRRVLSLLVFAVSPGSLLQTPAWAEPSLPPIFSTHAVLQGGASVPVWGGASPGERITVTLGPAQASATAGADGRWRVALDLSQSGPGPFELVVKGDSTLVITDVVVGEVWFASGQSNMEWVLRKTTGAEAEIERSANPGIRHFQVKKNTSPVPIEKFEGEWKVAGPSTAGDFTAAGYYFAKALNRATGHPIGLVHASWGATKVEGWTSPEGLARLPEVKASADRYRVEEQEFPARLAAFPEAFSVWAKKHGRVADGGLAPGEALGVASKLTWTPLRLPVAPGAGLPAGDGGVVWLRRTVNVPPASAGLSQPIEVGQIDGFYEIYFDGGKVDEVTPATGLRRPGVPFYFKESVMKAGDHELALRIHNPVGSPLAREGRPFRFIHRPLVDGWQISVERAFPAPEAAARAAMPAAPIQPMTRQDIGGYLYNAMVHPVIPYAIRGVIWYQGEGNSSRAAQYRDSFPNLIVDWRARWGIGDFPFYFCQLANFGAKSAEPREDGLAELREAQSLALKLPNTGQAVLIDIGEAEDIHPRNKREVGERLARIALADTYGRREIAFSGPIYASHRVEADRIRIAFAGAVGGLVAKELPAVYAPRSTADRTLPLERYSPDSEVQGFTICGEDRRWIWAHAKIEGDSVVVWAPGVKAPVAVRYGWTGNPTCNLYDGAGLPASPFRTDDFSLVTRDARY